MDGGLWAETKSWIEAPFRDYIGVGAIFWITGAVIVSVALWLFVLNKLKTEV